MSEKLKQIFREKNLYKGEALNQINQTVNLTRTVSLNFIYTCSLKHYRLRWFSATLASEGTWALEEYMTIWNLIFLMLFIL